MSAPTLTRAHLDRQRTVDRVLTDLANETAGQLLHPQILNGLRYSNSPLSSQAWAALYAGWLENTDILTRLLWDVHAADSDLELHTPVLHEDLPCTAVDDWCPTCQGVREDLKADALRALRAYLGDTVLTDLHDVAAA